VLIVALIAVAAPLISELPIGLRLPIRGGGNYARHRDEPLILGGAHASGYTVTEPARRRWVEDALR